LTHRSVVENLKLEFAMPLPASAAKRQSPRKGKSLVWFAHWWPTASKKPIVPVC